MNYLASLSLLLYLSILNFATLIFLSVMAFANVTTKQKITVIKVGLIVIGASPFIFIAMRLLPSHSLETIIPNIFINQITAYSTVDISTKPQMDLALYLLTVYIIGAIVMLLRLVFSYVSAKRQLFGSTLSIIQGQAILLNDRIQSPLSFGFPTGKIYLPAHFAQKWSAREIAMSLAHEKTHIDYNHHAWKLVSLLVQALLFFAPWSYLVHRRFELEMEIFCDLETCTRTNANINEYGYLLLDMTCVQPQNLMFANIKNSTLKRRLLAMKSKNKHRPFLVTTLSIALLFFGGTAIATANGALMKKNIFKITTKILIDGNIVSSPQIIAHSEQAATIALANKNGEKSLKITLIAKDLANGNIGINYDIEYANDVDRIHSKPKIIVIPNHESVIRIGSDSGHSYEMKVVAERE